MGTILAFRRDDEAAVPLAETGERLAWRDHHLSRVRIERGLWRDTPTETGAPSRRRAQGRRKK